MRYISACSARCLLRGSHGYIDVVEISVRGLAVCRRDIRSGVCSRSACLCCHFFWCCWKSRSLLSYRTACSHDDSCSHDDGCSFDWRDCCHSITATCCFNVTWQMQNVRLIYNTFITLFHVFSGSFIDFQGEKMLHSLLPIDRFSFRHLTFVTLTMCLSRGLSTDLVTSHL